MTPALGIRTRLALALLAVVAGALLGVYLMVVPSLERRLVGAKLDQLQQDAELIASDLAADPFVPQLDLDFRLAYYSSSYSSGVAVFEVGGPPLTLHAASFSGTATREVLERDRFALAAGRDTRIVRGRTVRGGREFAEVALPIFDGPEVLFTSGPRQGSLGSIDVVLLSDSLADQVATVTLIKRRLVYAAAVGVAIAFGLGATAAALHARRIRRIERAAHRIAGGRFDEPLEDMGNDEVGELARAFERMRVQLGALDSARKEFVANASHELRTPLFSIAGFLELLADEDLDEETRRGFVSTTREQVERLATLAAHLLDLSRLDAGKLRVEAEDVDLAEVARIVAEEFVPLAEASGHVLTVDAAREIWASADEERVVQIVRALTRNALVHTPSGTRVVVRACARPGGATVEVEDNGPGVPAEHVEAIFQRFHRVGGTRASGSGLGLAIARELAGVMNGRVGVESGPEATVFSLTLPLAGMEEPLQREAMASL